MSNPQFPQIKMKYYQDVRCEMKPINGSHYYGVEGFLYPSVTTILNAFPKGEPFNKWLKQNGMAADRIRDKAAREGSKAHDAIHKLILGETLYVNQYNENEWKFINRFVDWVSTLPSFKPILAEQTIYHPGKGYGGTTDLICQIGDDIWLIDFKTSKAVRDTHNLQLAAYMKAINMLVDLGILDCPKIQRCGDLILGARTKKGWYLSEIDNPGQLFDVFMHTFAVWKFKNPKTPVIKPELPNTLKLEING